jgi:HK97 family phage prohead protease
MNVRNKSFEVSIGSDSDDYQFSGYASTYGNADRVGDIFEKGAFDNTVSKKSVMPLLFNHDRNFVIGKVDASTDEHGLYVKGFLNLNDEKAKNVYDLLKMGALDSMSINFAYKDYSPIDISKPFGPALIKDVDLFEVSVVTVPANEEAQINNVKSIDDEIRKIFIEDTKKAIQELLCENKKKSILDQIKNFKEKKQ